MGEEIIIDDLDADRFLPTGGLIDLSSITLSYLSFYFVDLLFMMYFPHSSFSTKILF